MKAYQKILDFIGEEDKPLFALIKEIQDKEIEHVKDLKEFQVKFS